MTTFEYGYNNEIKKKVAGKASTQLEDESIKKANRYASDIVNSELEVPEGFVITVDQNNGTITSTEPFANSISSITEKLAAQTLRFNFNEQEAKSKIEWQQAIDELANIKKSLAKLGVVVTTKTIAYSRPLTFPSDPLGQFISGVRKHVERWN